MDGPRSGHSPPFYKLTGSVPGQLDPSQSARLLRVPNGTLAFASFDPRAATAHLDIPDVRKLSLNEELCRPKRIVLESMPSGEISWRFVPKARCEEGVEDEGVWPRTVNICGQLVECSQDQWDIYKLDPMYDCYVRTTPELTVISRVSSHQSTNLPPVTPESASGKRHLSDSPSPRPSSSKRPTVEDAESSDDDLSETMVVDDGAPLRPRALSNGPSIHAKRKQMIRQGRQARRERIVKRANKLHEQQENKDFNFSAPTLGEPEFSPPDKIKRKAASLVDSIKSVSNPEFDEAALAEERSAPMYQTTTKAKRTRTLSPTSAQRDLQAKKIERDRLKKERRQHEQELRRQARDQQMVQELYAGLENTASPNAAKNVMQDHTNNDGHDTSRTDDFKGDNKPNTTVGDEEQARFAAIAESKRKLAELEKDRPIWEQQARKREAQERLEQERLRAKSEARRLQEEERIAAERQARAEQAAQEVRLKQEALHREREETARREKERQQRQQRWSTGQWTKARAIERYKAFSESFDATKFSPDYPLRFEDVPWPVLHPPVSLTIEDIEWNAVEKFFEAAKSQMRTQDYKTFVQTSHRRFHPDRWRARGLLKSIGEESERDLLEVAANTVAQALTPVWRELKK